MEKNISEYERLKIMHDSKEANEKYIATPNDIAKIVAYCLSMTIHGNQNKDWIGNVLTAIEGINGVCYDEEKVKLSKLKKQRV